MLFHEFIVDVPKDFVANRFGVAGVAAHFHACIFYFPFVSVAGHAGVCRFVGVRISYAGMTENSVERSGYLPGQIAC